MARALDALARRECRGAGDFQFQLPAELLLLVRKDELERPLRGARSRAWRSNWRTAICSPIEVDENVGLLAVVGEGMQGKPGLAGRIFTAISREQVNIIAIAQGSSELTIAIVVSREGLEKAVHAVHEECGLGQ